VRRFLALLLLSLLASADTVWVKGGRRIEGLVVREGDEVVVNEFYSAVDGVQLGTHRIPKDRVKKIRRTRPRPRHEFQRRLRALVAPAPSRGWEDEERTDPTKGLLELAAWCKEERLKDERTYALELVLRIDPEHEEARKLLGSKAPKGSWVEQTRLAREYVSTDDPAKRAEAAAAIRKDRHFPFDFDYLDRARRSFLQPKGYQKDRPVAMRADRLAENARYTLFVPDRYDPLRPTPLVIGLHGGGPGGADGKLVVGTGWQAMNFYRAACAARGWICACPTAVQAGWRGPNDDLIDAVLDELCALYNVDENRIYLVGHSMGGGGTWFQGTRIPETWAAIAPAASFGVPGFKKLERTATGFYVYHSDNDPRTPVDGVRPRMVSLAGSDTDFVYTELPGRGHAFPGEVVKDIFRFFDMRTLARGPGRFRPEARPRSSFLRRVSRDEKKYLAELGADAAAPEGESLSSLLEDLRTGGGVAEAAVPGLVAHADEKTSSKVARILVKSTSGPDVRRYAARVLGGRKAADQIKYLGRALLVEEESNALLEILDALGEINDPEAGDAVLRFLEKRAGYFERRTQGDVMHHSDWSAIVPTLARACALVGTFKPGRGASVIERTVVAGVFLSRTGVIFDVQNQNPRPAAHALADAACGALARIGGEDARDALARLAEAAKGGTDVDIEKKNAMVAVMRGWAKDPRVAAAVRAALEGLRE